MATEMIRVDSEVIQQALKKKPNYLTKAGYFSLLIAESLDSPITMKRPPGRYSYSSNSNSFEELEKESMREKGRETFLTPVSENFICHDPEKHKAFLKEQKKVAQKLPTAFLQFWETYQTAPRKANQSRKKAFEAWKEALKIENSDRLLEAARRAVLDLSLIHI